jgi:chromosome segregation ATPase
MFYIIAAVCSLITLGAALGSIIGYRKYAASGGGGQIEGKNASIDKLGKDLESLIQYENSYATKGQHKTLLGLLSDAKDVFAKQQAQLKEIEAALSKAQKAVEEKEVQQQEVKTLKEEDETKLIELLTTFETLSSESITLEGELAATLKNVEEMLASATLTDQEKEILTEFNETLFSASSRLRDLMTEYGVVKERLEGLQGQFKDLEEEYTRLVEQQLGVS